MFCGEFYFFSSLQGKRTEIQSPIMWPSAKSPKFKVQSRKFHKEWGPFLNIKERERERERERAKRTESFFFFVKRTESLESESGEKKQVGITWACCCLSLPPHHDLLLHQHHRRHPLILPQDSPSTAPPWLTIRYSPPPFTFSVFIVWLLRKRWEIRVVVGSSVRVGNVGSRFWVFFFYFSFFF
jgi:hypothetical protein